MLIGRYYFSLNDTRRIDVKRNILSVIQTESISCFLKNLDNDQQIFLSSNLIIECTGFKSADEIINYSKIIYFGLNMFGFLYDARIHKLIDNRSNRLDMNKPRLENYVEVIDIDKTETLQLGLDVKYYKMYNDDLTFLTQSMKKYMYLTDNELSILSFSLEKFNSSIEEIDSTNAIVNIIIGLEALTNLLSQNELTSSEEQIDLVKKIYNCIDIESKTKLTNDIKSTFGKLKKKNIQDQIIYLLRKANQPLNIMEMSFAEFIKKCYQIRSDIVHAKKEYLISNDSISANVTRMKKELTTITRNFLFMYFYEKEVKG